MKTNVRTVAIEMENRTEEWRFWPDLEKEKIGIDHSEKPTEIFRSIEDCKIISRTIEARFPTDSDAARITEIIEECEREIKTKSNDTGSRERIIERGN